MYEKRIFGSRKDAVDWLRSVFARHDLDPDRAEQAQRYMEMQGDCTILPVTRDGERFYQREIGLDPDNRAGVIRLHEDAASLAPRPDTPFGETTCLRGDGVNVVESFMLRRDWIKNEQSIYDGFAASSQQERWAIAGDVLDQAISENLVTLKANGALDFRGLDMSALDKLVQAKIREAKESQGVAPGQ